MNGSSRLFALALTAALACLSGCGVYFKSTDANGVKVKTGAKRPFTTDPADGLDTYTNLKWTKAGGSFDARVKWDLQGDYRVDTTSGFVSAQNALDFGTDGSYGVSLDVMGSNPAKSYRIEATYAAPGTMTLSASIREGATDTPLGTLALPGTFNGDYSIDNQGGNLRFLGRSHGIGAYQLIGQTTSPPLSEVLCVHYFASDFAKGAQLALDDYNIFNGTQPGTPAPAPFVQHRMRQIETPLYDAFYKADALLFEAALVRSALLVAQAEHQLFLGQLAARYKRPGPKAYAKVLTTLDVIRTAVSQIDSGDAAASEKGRQKLLKTITKAIKSDVGALTIVDTLK